MSAHVLIVLDTTAPAVVFGDPTGAVAGEYLRIPYVTDEPLAVATLVLADQRPLELAVAPDVLSVLLPVDAPDGWVKIEWADDVGNAASAVPFRISGAIVTPPPVTPPRPPSGPPAVKRPMIRRRLTARSSITVTSRSRRIETSRTRQRRQVLTVVSRSRRRAEVSRVGPGHSTSYVTSRATVRAAAVGHASLTTASRATIRRRDDPDIEAIILDLL